MTKRQPSATEELLRIALGIGIFVVFFGTLVVRGLGTIPEPVVWVGGGVTLLILVVLVRLIRYRFGQILGHVVHALFLGSFAIDEVVGAAMLVPIGFWIFAVWRGGRLDRAAPPRDTPA